LTGTTAARRSLLRAEEVAEILNIPVATIRWWSWRGTLPCIRLGRCVRFDPYDIEAFVERGRAQVVA
jgi:excisionase family DNA binding protein